jgi:tetratricopeptide (TPR) repeat protein
MSGSTRKTLFLIVVIVLVAAESLYFGRQVFAGYQRILGRGAFINSDFGPAWEAYGSAIRWGGDRASLEAEILDLLVFGLLQSEAGIELDMPVTPAESLSLARNLVARRLRESPGDAHIWSKDADLKFYAARQVRRGTPIDVSQLSENPRENLLEEEKAAVASLETAASLEPNSYFYHDLLVLFFMEIGALGEAAEHVRKAVVSYPRLDGHIYLNERNVPGEILNAAIAGFRDAAGSVSLVRRAYIQVDAGRLLMLRGDDQEAIVFFEQAIADAPDLFDAHYRLGQVFYRSGDYVRAVEHLREATELLPSVASPYYSLGRSYAALGSLSAAIEALTLARQKNPELLKFRHELGKTLEEAGRLSEAERQFVAAANVRPDDPVAWLELMRFYSRRQDRPSAYKACARLLSLDEDNQDYQERCDALKQDSR